MKNIFYEILYRLNLKTRPSGFSQLMYKGKPVIQRDYIPQNEVWFIKTKKKISPWNLTDEMILGMDKLKD